MKSARVVVALLIVGVGLHGWTGPSGAAELNTAGWWWRAQTGTVALPPPPHVPANGLSVGNAPDGPSAVAAVRFALLASEIQPALTLTVAEVFAPGTLGLVACPATAPWFGVQAGNWDDRPAADCAGVAVNGVEAEDGASWTFPLAGVHSDGVLDVVIQPAEGSDPFEISFEPPTDQSLRTTQATGGFDVGSGSDSAGEQSFVPPSGFGGVDFGRPFSPPSAPPGPAAAPADPPTSIAPRRLVPIAQGPTPESPVDPRPLAVVVLLAALATAVLLRREPLPAPRLLGPMVGRRELEIEEPEERGLGRFRRPRRGTAPSLH